MRRTRTLWSVTIPAALLLVWGCGGGERAAPAEESADTPQMTADAGQALSCFVQGDPAEAAARPSPLAETDIVLGGEHAKLCYGAPSARGREIMGGLVPFGAYWRAGANEATAIHLPFAARIGTVDVEPGSYSLYMKPGESEWEVVVNSAWERWGIPINSEVRAADIGSFTVPAEATGSMVETLTYSWRPETDTMGWLVMEWENTSVAIPIERR